MSPQPAPPATLESVRTFWEGHLNNEYYTRAERASQAYWKEIQERRYRHHYHLRDLFAELKGSTGRLLEVGCGIGVDSSELARAGFSVTAVDLTEPAIEIARAQARLQGLRIDFQVGDAERLEFPDGSFDAAYSFGVLHHTPRIEAAVAELHRVLKPGATAHVMLYHRRSLVSWVHRLFFLPYESPRTLRDHCPVVYTFSRGEARKLFGMFSSVEVRTAYPFTYGFRRFSGLLPERVIRHLGRWIGWHLMIRATR